VIWSIVWSS